MGAIQVYLNNDIIPWSIPAHPYNYIPTQENNLEYLEAKP